MVINKGGERNRQGEHCCKNTLRDAKAGVDARGWVTTRSSAPIKKEARREDGDAPRAPSPNPTPIPPTGPGSQRPNRLEKHVPRSRWYTDRTPSPTSGVARRRGSCGRPTRPSLSAPVHKQNFAALLTPSTRRRSTARRTQWLICAHRSAPSRASSGASRSCTAARRTSCGRDTWLRLHWKTRRPTSASGRSAARS